MSLWDTYRTQGALFTFVAPAVLKDIVNSLVDMGNKRGGVMPKWPLISFEAHSMVGSHGIVVGVDAILKGVKGIET